MQDGEGMGEAKLRAEAGPMGTGNIFIITLPGIELVGEVPMPLPKEGWHPLTDPISLQLNNGQITLNKMTGTRLVRGKSVLINFSNVSWVSEPADELLKAYTAQRHGLVIATEQPPPPPRIMLPQ